MACFMLPLRNIPLSICTTLDVSICLLKASCVLARFNNYDQSNCNSQCASFTPYITLLMSKQDGAGFLDHMARLFRIGRNGQAIFRVAVPFCIPTSNIWQWGYLNLRGKSVLGILYRGTKRAEPSLGERVVEKVSEKERHCYNAHATTDTLTSPPALDWLR